MKTRSMTRRVGRVRAPGTQRIQRQQLQIKEVLVPTDFSRPSANALKYAIAFARQFKARITLHYVVEPRSYSDFVAADATVEKELAKQAWEKLTALRLQQGRNARWIKDVRVTVGKPFEEIVRTARGLKYDLIIIATHGRTGLKHVLLGSTAEKVVRHADCPVFVVRESGHEIVAS